MTAILKKEAGFGLHGLSRLRSSMGTQAFVVGRANRHPA